MTSFIDEVYVAERNKLIPEAERLARKRAAIITSTKANSRLLCRRTVDREFIKAMNELAVEKGLVSPTILDFQKLKHKRLPYGWSGK